MNKQYLTQNLLWQRHLSILLMLLFEVFELMVLKCITIRGFIGSLKQVERILLYLLCLSLSLCLSVCEPTSSLRSTYTIPCVRICVQTILDQRLLSVVRLSACSSEIQSWTSFGSGVYLSVLGCQQRVQVFSQSKQLVRQAGWKERGSQPASQNSFFLFSVWEWVLICIKKECTYVTSRPSLEVC